MRVGELLPRLSILTALGEMGCRSFVPVPVAVLGTAGRMNGAKRPHKNEIRKDFYLREKSSEFQITLHPLFRGRCSAPISPKQRFISVALSRRLRVADVISYPVPRSPDFPHTDTFRRDRARPSDKATIAIIPKKGLRVN